MSHKHRKKKKKIIEKVEIHKKDFLPSTLEFYKENNFDLVPIQRDGKIPIECYDEKTEILTDSGFKFFKDLKDTDLVGERLSNNQIYFIKPIKVIKEYYEGEMYNVCNKNMDLLVTPNHNIFYKTQNNNYKFRTIKKLYNLKAKNNKYYISSNFLWEGQEKEIFSSFNIKMDLWLEFLGYYLSEGWTTGQNTYKVGIGQKRSWKKDKIRNLLHQLPFKFLELEDRFTCNNKYLYKYLKQFGKSKNKFISREFLNLSKRQLRILLDALMIGDGHIPKKEYFTVSESLRDNVYELLLKLGYIVNYHEDNFKNISWSKLWTVKQISWKHRTIKKEQIKIVKYKGHVYCVEVPTNIIFIRRNGKSYWCGNSNWTNREHKDMIEWDNWLNEGLNIGVKCGKSSGITILDLDVKEIPDDLKPFLENFKGLMQESTKGYHYFFRHIDVHSTRIDKYKLDIRNDGTQVVIYPSKVEGIERKLFEAKIPKMTKEFKEFLLSCKDIKLSDVIEEKKEVKEIKEEDLNVENIQSIKTGNRTNYLMTLGGILRKKLNLDQTEYVLNFVNKNHCKPPHNNYEFKNIIKSLSKYDGFDNKYLASRILSHLKLTDKIGGASSRDLKEITDEKKIVIDKALAYLMKEEYIIKRRNMYRAISKADWKEEFMDYGQEINYQFPYFYDRAIIRSGDMIIIGSKSGFGKTHIAMNIVKRLIDQKIKPYYITLESGNRWAIIAKKLGLVEGQFKWDCHYEPEHIELEKNVFTIIDWLLPKDYAETDKTFDYFSKQLKKNNGILVIFCQLKDDGKFYAEAMLKFFASVVARFLYENDEDTTKGYFDFRKIREARIRNWHTKMPTLYGWDSKILNRVNEIKNEENSL